MIQVENLYSNDSKIEFHIGNYTHEFKRMDTEILPFIIIKPETNISYVLSEICVLVDIFNYSKASIHHNHHGCGLFPEEERDKSGNVIAFSHQSGFYERIHQHGESRITVTIREHNDPVVQYYKLFKSLFFGNVEVNTHYTSFPINLEYERHKRYSSSLPVLEPPSFLYLWEF